MNYSEEHRLEVLKSLVTVSMEGMKTLALINGGAAVAVVAAYDKLHVFLPPASLKTAVIGFCVGLIAVVLAMMVAYLTQLALFVEERDDKNRGGHHKYLVITFLLCGVSVGAFAITAIRAASSAI